jgi:ATP adenylyltransferase
MTSAFPISDLEDFIRYRMRMSHIYQPAMIRVLLEEGGHASLEKIAQELLRHDRSQVEYYEIRTKQMVGKVLTNNGVVKPLRNGNRIVGYELNVDLGDHDNTAHLIDLCDKKLAEFVSARGKQIWDHRAGAGGYIPGSVRYEVLKRAKGRCELCGAHETQAALHVDHIIPRAKGGSDEISNFQSLCITCNTSKRDRDDTDFRNVLASYNLRSEECLFCQVDTSRIVAENELSYAIRDGFPVTAMHTLIIPKRHVADYFELYQPELNAIHQLLASQRRLILDQDKSVTGFNVGVNSGSDAGQTIFHAHVHLIPRRAADVEEPRGGVRGVIPSKQSY